MNIINFKDFIRVGILFGNSIISVIQLILLVGGPSLLDFYLCTTLTILPNVESEYTNFLLIFLLIIPLILLLVWGEKTMGHFLCPSLART